MADIAEEAGIAYGLIYRYFPSKDDLLIAIFQENTQVYLKKIEQISRDYFDPAISCVAWCSISLIIFKRALIW